MSVYDSKAFKRLKAKWYKKLEGSGFQDAEDTAYDTDKTLLRRWDSLYFERRHTPQDADAITTYYRHCGLFLHTYMFSSPRERLIFWMHAKGYGLRDTARYFGVSHETIAKVLRPLIKAMKGYDYGD